MTTTTASATTASATTTPATPTAAPLAGSPAAAARRVITANTMHLTLPFGLGEVTLPAPQRLAWYGGVVAIAALELIDWPIAIVLLVGHALAEDHHHRVLQDFGEALEEA
jgi:hypothetical protein